jgi:hypothetical protein
LKKGDALIAIGFQYRFRIYIGRLQVNQEGLKLNGTHQILVYVDDVNMMVGSTSTRNKKHRSLISHK